MAVGRKATRTAHGRLVERAAEAGFRLPPLDAPPADPAIAKRIETAILRARLARQAAHDERGC
ncbi:hypothetical protein [Streptomyces sp. NPDC048272]|uniref:hypothetical protein n=1 Tax=Streptomyces sp. NPDC048272 TaxID=3154616 RepID=UPI0034360784